jgi:hypothetical protein
MRLCMAVCWAAARLCCNAEYSAASLAQRLDRVREEGRHALEHQPEMLQASARPNPEQDSRGLARAQGQGDRREKPRVFGDRVPEHYLPAGWLQELGVSALLETWRNRQGVYGPIKVRDVVGLLFCMTTCRLQTPASPALWPGRAPRSASNKALMGWRTRANRGHLRRRLA